MLVTSVRYDIRKITGPTENDPNKRVGSLGLLKDKNMVFSNGHVHTKACTAKIQKIELTFNIWY